ncbi:MAG: flagellar biosynthetic protein FliR [Gammaproteobacteria bacterium]|nr:flagellar biosynthetic protein FliR [Gammaproteobacteria bacterium]
MHFTAAEITAWIGTFLWPFFRIGSMFMVAPITSGQYVPVRARLMLSVAVTLVVMPLLPASPLIDPFSLVAITLILQQLLIGVAMGFILLLVFTAIVTGGQLIAMQMGLGFASMVDPANGQQVPVLSQLYLIMITLLFLVMDGHLVLIALLVESFQTLPIGPTGVDRDSFWAIAMWGNNLFSGAVWMALPALASLLMVNIAFGVMARAAPQLNIFAIGFPVAIMVGYIVVLYTLPNIAPQFSVLLEQGFDLVQFLITAVR